MPPAPGPRARVAVLERGGRFVLAALGARSGGSVRVTAEDGRSFDYPEERVLWTARVLSLEDAGPATLAAALAALRAAAAAGPAPPSWESLRAGAPAGAPVDLHDLAGGGAGEEGDRAALRLALRAGEAHPHFRNEKGHLVAATDEQVARSREHARAEEGRRRAAAALVAALRPGAPPAGPEAAPAVEEVLAWALGPGHAGPAPAAAKAAALPDADAALARLDAAGLLPAGAIAALSRREIPVAFPAAARRAAAEALGAPDPAAAREDLGDLPSLAVDDPETVEVDDAFSLVRGRGGEAHLLVHIADAAAAVPPGGDLDLEARRRAATIYLPDLRVPMFPLDLVARRLSLVPGEPRDCVTLECRAGSGGELEVVRLFRSRLRLGARAGYEATRDPSGLPDWARPLVEVAEALRAARRAAGARLVEGASPHLRVVDGVPVLRLRGGGAGDLVTAEAAVAFNRAAAERLRGAGAPALWRAQDPPRGPEPAADDPLRELRARRGFAPARLSPRPEPHSGVGAPCYLQATSPIRRWADLLHQRQLVALLEGRPPPHGEEEVRALAPDLARRERDGHRAAEEREDQWLAVLLEGRRGEVFEAVCSRSPERGRGKAWIPALAQERPFAWGPEAGPPPADGAPLRLRPGRLDFHRGRVEFEPAPPA